MASPEAAAREHAHDRVVPRAMTNAVPCGVETGLRAVAAAMLAGAASSGIAWLLDLGALHPPSR